MQISIKSKMKKLQMNCWYRSLFGTDEISGENSIFSVKRRGIGSQYYASFSSGRTAGTFHNYKD
jgi:hypothetical protein